jgi:hypothetical protein
VGSGWVGIVILDEFVLMVEASKLALLSVEDVDKPAGDWELGGVKRKYFFRFQSLILSVTKSVMNFFLRSKKFSFKFGSLPLGTDSNDLSYNSIKI